MVVEIKAGQRGTGSASEGSILSQPLEYAQSLSDVSYEDIEEAYSEFKRNCQDRSWDVGYGTVIEETVQEVHDRWFGRSLDTDDFNEHQRIVIVAEVITNKTENNVEYLLKQGLLMQCVEVQLLGATDQPDDEVLAATTVVDYPRSRVQPEDTSVDYTKLLMRVRDLAYQELEEPLQLENRNTIASPSSSRDLHFTSGHPAHPDPLVYRFEPRLVEEGALKFKLCVFGPDDGQDTPIREFLVEQTEKLDGFELGERYAEGMTVGKKRVEVSGKGDKAEMAEELVDIVLTVHQEALEAFENHPAFDD